MESGINDWIKIEKVTNKEEVKLLQAILDIGEAEVIILGKETNADLLIIDNKEPRLFAKNLDIKVIGTIGIILLAYSKEVIKNPMELILKLREEGFYISEKLIKEIKVELKNRFKFK